MKERVDLGKSRLGCVHKKLHFCWPMSSTSGGKRQLDKVVMLLNSWCDKIAANVAESATKLIVLQGNRVAPHPPVSYILLLVDTRFYPRCQYVALCGLGHVAEAVCHGDFIFGEMPAALCFESRCAQV
jgi:hypothetical protein